MSTIEKKYTRLRDRLDTFGYKAPLGVESIPLVERVFADLIHTTESLKKSRMRDSRSNQSYQQQQQPELDLTKAVDEALMPYREDNSRLMGENNELHQSILDMKQKTEETKVEFKQHARKLQNENQDLRFLNTQYLTKIKQVERDSHSKSEKIRQLQEKNMATVVSTPSKSAKKVTAPRRQKVTIDATIPFAKIQAPPIPMPDDLVLIDVLKMAEQRSAQLEQQVKALKTAQKGADDRIEHVRRQKALVEGENDRLRRQLEGGRPREAVTMEQATRATEKVIEQLNLQLEISQESQREAEDHSARLLLEIDELKERNDKLKGEMNDIGQMATVLEQERIQAVERAERAHNDINVAKLTTKSRELEDQLEEALRARYAVELKLSELKETYEKVVAAEPADVVKLRKERDFYQNAYRTMSEREHGSDEHITTGQVTRLINDKDEKTKKLLDAENRLNETQGNLRVVQQERDRLQLQVEQAQGELAQMRRDAVDRGTERQRQSPTKSTPQAIIKRVENERDQAVLELRRVSCERDSLLEQVKANRERKLCDTVELEQKCEDQENRSRLLENERRDLLLQCADVKSQLDLINGEKHELDLKLGRSEIDCEQLRVELDEVRCARNQLEQTHQDQTRSTYMLRAELEAEREKTSALEERVEILSRNTTDVSAEITRLKAAVTALDRERDALSGALDDKTESLVTLEKSAKTSEIELGECRFKMAKLEQEIELLHDQIDDQDRQAHHQRNMLDEKRATETELFAYREATTKEKRELATKLEIMTREIVQLKKELSIAVSGNEQQEAIVTQYTDRVNGLESQLTATRNELAEVSTHNHRLLEECQQLQHELQQRIQLAELNDKQRQSLDHDRTAIADRAIQLEAEIIQHIQAQSDNEAQISVLTSNLHRCEQILNEKQAEVDGLSVALEGAQSLAVQLQTTSDQQTHQLSQHMNESINRERAQEEMRLEMDHVRKEQREAKNEIYMLEATIQKLREEHFEAELVQVELKAELDANKDEAQSSNRRATAADDELIKARARCTELDSELEATKRQVTDLKFQNERTNQELKRLMNQSNQRVLDLE